MGCVYKATNTVNNKIYIGKTIRPFKMRRDEHKLASGKPIGRGTTYFHKAIAKHGYDSFIWEQVFISDSNEELLEKEKYYIELYKCLDKKHGYNLTAGGEGITGMVFSEESKKKISDAHKKLCQSPERIAQMSASTKKYFLEHPEAGEAIGKMNTARLSILWKDEKYIAWQKERSAGGNNPAARKIVCIETGKEYDCIKNAANEYGVQESSIRGALNNPRHSCVKLHWAYREAVDSIDSLTRYRELVEQNKRILKPKKITQHSKCIICGKEFDYIKSRRNKYIRQTCSDSCEYQYLSRNKTEFYAKKESA